MKKLLLFLLIILGSQAGIAQVVNTEGFESGVFPPTGWTSVGSTSYWNTVTSGTTGYPSVTVYPHSGSYEGYFNSYSAFSGTNQTICSPSFTRSAVGAAIDSIGFWMYRDNGYISDADEITVYISTTPDLSAATTVGTVARSTGIATPVTVSSNGWYYYSFVVPAGYTGSTNYILIKAVSEYGNNMFIDDISWTSWPPACGGAPTAGTVSGPSAICPATSFDLTLSGDSVASGLSYQWYSATPAGSTSFTAIAGATNGFYIVPSQADTTSYKLVVTCIASGLADSTPVITVNENPFYTCYCSSGLGGDGYSAPIDSVAIAGTTLNNYTPYSTTTYASFPATGSTTCTLQQSLTYTMFVNSNGYDNYTAAMWIDYDHSGTYDAGEYTSIASSAAIGTSSNSFTVSSTSLTGLTGMRVRTIPYFYSMGSTDACTYEYDGQTQDYMITLIPAIPCNGAPAPGTAFASATGVCAGAAFNLSDTGATFAGGITGQWYSSPAGAATWSALYGGSSAFVTGVSQYVASDYIYVVTCSNSGISDTSNILTVGMNPFYLCYCSPLTGTTLDYYASYSPIDSFGIGGTTLNNYTPYSSALYTQYWPVTATTTGDMNQGNTYTAGINSSGYDDYNAIMWIDFDHSGTFDYSESFTLASNATSYSTSSGTFMVPGTADTGVTGLRVRCVPYYYTIGGGDACTEDYDGAVQDYVINILPGVPCSGAPAAGTAYSPFTTVCATGSFTLNDTGYANGLGITYQWYSSPSGAATWSALYGGSATTVAGVTQTAPTDYIFVVTCTNSGISDTSNILTIGMSPFYLCYCSPLTGTTLDNYSYATPIDNFTILGTTLNNTDYSGAMYTQYWPVTATTTATVNQGSTYTAQINCDGYDDYSAAIWVDFDHSGTFDNSEYFSIANDAPDYSTTSGSFLVPATADTGITGLRVRSVAYYYYMGAYDACTDEYDGNVQDYVINIQPGIPCAGAPAPGTAFANVTTICDGASFNLNDTGCANGLGISYQWYSSPTGAATWSALYGGSTAAVAGVTQVGATDYIFVTTCANSGISDTSNIITVAASPFYLCYCSPLTGVTLDYYAYASPIDSVYIAGTTLNNPTPYSSAIYTQYWPVTPTTTATLLQADYYSLSVNSNGYDNYNAAAWIDYDHSGTFDAGELIPLGSNITYGVTTTTNFLIPAGADTGITGLRIRVVPYYYTPFSGTDACTEDYYGAVADYVINIGPGIPCSGAPTAGGIVAPTTICSNVMLNLSDTGFTTGLALTYQWLSSPAGAGTFTAIPGATSYTYSYLQPAATDYEFVVTCTTSGLSDTSAVMSVDETPFYMCYCNDGNLNTYSSYTQMDSVSILGTTLSVYNGTGTPYIQFPGVGDSTATLTQAFPYTMDINVTSSFFGDSYNAAMWIDYNQDGTFEPSEYTLIANSASNPSSSTATFIVPVSALTGTTGMRVRTVPYYYTLGAGDACTDFYDGETYDFTVNIAPAPVCAGAPSPGLATASSGSACDTSTITLSDLTAATSTGLAFQWETSADGITWTDISGATTDPYTFSGFLASASYRMIVTCTASSLSDTSNVVSIVHTPCYCTMPLWAFASYGSNPTGDAMSQFSATGGYAGTSISDATIIPDCNPADGYTDHTGLTPMQMQQGTSYPITVTYNTSSYGWENQVWIDFGDDGTFDMTDTVCGAFGVAPYGTSTTSNSSFINIPATATPGYHRMRVRNTWMDWSSYSSSTGFSDPMDPCAQSDPNVTYGDGDVVDYTVYIVPPYCDSVTGITVTGVTSSTATATWTATSGSVAYVYTVTTSPTAPTTTGGTTTTATTVALTGLIPGTTYYVYVLNSCTSGSTSVWETSGAFTTNCDTVTSLAVSAITGVSATITWSPVAGSTTYDYQVDNTPGAPSGSGTATTATTDNATGLVPGTTYYAHVRNSCPGGGFSAWVTVPFTTPCDTVTSLAVSGITDTSATISWSSIGSTVFQYVVDNSSTAPSGSGTTTSATSVTVSPLLGGVTYYAHVRDSCAGGGYAAWVTVPFTTSFCDSILPGTISIAANDTGLIFSFTGVSGSIGYYYTVNTTPGAPGSGGIFTTNTTDTVSGLTPGSSYYIHIRTGCGSGYSTWTTVPFTTTICDSVTGLTILSTSDTGMIFTFTGTTGGYGYDYVITTTPAAPGGGGTFTTSTIDTVTGLTPGTIYYVWVRTACGGGYSTWTNATGTTQACDTAMVSVFANDTFAFVTWVPDSGVAGYVYVIDTNPGTPTGGGTFTTSTADSITSGLVAGTTYYAHVQVICGGGDSSAWVTVPFMLSPCDTTVATLLSYDSSTQMAHIGWIFQASSGYNYALDTNPGAPTSGITFVPAIDTSANFGPLNPNTTYYFHIQVVCGTGTGGTTSSWITISFTTPPPVSVVNVNNADFGVQAFPNPAINVVTVKVTGNAGTHRVVELTDVTGKILKRVDMVANQVDVDMSDIAAGIYMIKYVDDDHNQVIKINKQ